MGTGSIFWLYAGSLIAGLDFGPATSGIFCSLMPLASPDRRGALITAIYLIVFLSFGVPVVIAGAAATRCVLHDTTYAYGLVVMLLATINTVAVWRSKAS